jgi:hypothetical protein
MAAILLFLKEIPKKLVGDAKACFCVQTTAVLRGSQAYFRFNFVYFLTKFKLLLLSAVKTNICLCGVKLLHSLQNF